LADFLSSFINRFAGRFVVACTNVSCKELRPGTIFGAYGHVRNTSVRMYTFGAPRVGNSDFARFFDSLGMEAFRIVNGG